MERTSPENRLFKLYMHVCTRVCICVCDVILYDLIGVGMQRLQTLMQSLLLRRTKEEIGNDGQPLVRLGIT